jgi:hypothetical protein
LKLEVTQFSGSGVSSPEDRARIEACKEEIERLKAEEAVLDESIKTVQNNLRDFVEDPEASKYPYFFLHESLLLYIDFCDT